MIRKLNSFYLFDNKLLYASAYFVGYNPIISKELSFQKPQAGQTLVKPDQFQLNGKIFTVTLTSYMDYGPIRGYNEMVIINDQKTMIHFRKGSHGHGSNYSSGNEYMIDNTDAYLIVQGYSMRDIQSDKIYSDLVGESYYLLWFKDVIIPTKQELITEHKKIRSKEIYKREEIEPLRQIDWEANIQLNDQFLQIVKSSIPGFYMSLWRQGGYEEFRQHKNLNALNMVEIVTDGLNYVDMQ